MNELKPEDVMRALECHSGDGDCFKVCPYFTNVYDESCIKNLMRDALALLREKDAEIERLSAENEEQGQAIIRALHSMGEIRRTARAEAITEFVDRLKERMREVYPADIYDSDIDQIANELKEEPYEQM